MNKLIVISSGSFPYGGAATNRHLSYLKGMAELGLGIIKNIAGREPWLMVFAKYMTKN
ncbi:MAG: hypothetical protein PHT92_03550 [Bacteroidales bacterium]|nr:hypothetical protein [Bacteroidales bacterium]